MTHHSGVRFLFTAAYYKPASRGGGLIHALANLAEELKRQGHDVWVTASDRDLDRALPVTCFHAVEIEGVNVCYFPTRPFCWQRLPVPRLRRTAVFRFHPGFRQWMRAKTERWDVVDTQLGFLSSTPFCARLARRCGKIHLYRQQGNLDPLRFGRNAPLKRVYIELVEKGCIRRADACIALSAREVDTYRQWVPDARVAYIPNGIPLAAWTTPARPSAAFGQVLGALAPDARLFVWMGRFSRLKGPDLFVEAFAQIAERQPRARAILAGPDQEQLRPVCERMAVQRNCAGRVRFFDNLVGGDRAALLQRADVFVLPTGGEGFSMALLEAMACRCAILTTPEANFFEIAEHQAEIICARTVAALTAVMQTLADTPETRFRTFGENGHRLVQSRYDIVRVARQYAQLCEELQSRKRARKFPRDGLAEPQERWRR